MRMRLGWLLLSLTAMLLGGQVFASGRRPLSQPAETAAGNPTDMVFRLHVDRKANRRWVSASGRIVASTPTDFAAFREANDVAGLTVYLDSFGGHLAAGLTLGHMIRQARLDTAVGRTLRTVDADGQSRPALVTHNIACNSACVYVLMGGVDRSVSPSARLGVHQFSGRLRDDGTAVDASFGLEEFRYAQRQSGQLAIYMQAMNVDLRLLDVINSMPFGDDLRALTRREIESNRLARIREWRDDSAQDVAWSYFARPDDPMLYRRIAVEQPQGGRLAYELSLRCRPNGAYALSFKGTVLATAEAVTRRWQRLRFGSGTAEVLWSDEGANPILLQGRGSAWINANASARFLNEAIASTGLSIDIATAADADYERAVALGDGGFATQAVAFAEACRGTGDVAALR